MPTLPPPSWLTLPEAISWLMEQGISESDAKSVLPRAFRDDEIRTRGRSRKYTGHDVKTEMHGVAWDQATVNWGESSFSIPAEHKSLKPTQITEVDVSRDGLCRWLGKNESKSVSGITPTARTHLQLVEIAAKWSSELPGQKEDDILCALLTAYFEKKFARTFLIDQNKIDEIDLNDLVNSKGGFFGVAPNFTDPFAYRNSPESEAEGVYLHGFALERSDFFKWCREHNETPPKFWRDRPVTENEQSPAPRRVRKPEYDWETFYVEIAAVADLDGLPETQAVLERHMAEWCSKNWGKEPSESTLRSKISPIYNHPRKRRGQ